MDERHPLSRNAPALKAPDLTHDVKGFLAHPTVGTLPIGKIECVNPPQTSSGQSNILVELDSGRLKRLPFPDRPAADAFYAEAQRELSAFAKRGR